MSIRRHEKFLIVTNVFNFISILGLLKILNIVKKVDRKEVVNKEKSLERINAYYKLTYEWMQIKNQGKVVTNFLQKNNINKIAIYGKGSLGELFLQELKNSNIKVVCFIDQNYSRKPQTENAVPIISIKKFTELGTDVDAVIVTPIHIYDDIKNEISSIIKCDKIISLEDIIYKCI